MTYKTTEKNTFKKDPLKGLEIHQDKPVRYFPVVQIFFVLFMIAVTLMAVKLWSDMAKHSEPTYITER